MHHLVEESENDQEPDEGDREQDSSHTHSSSHETERLRQREREREQGQRLVQRLLRRATFLSDYDELCGRHLHKFASQSALQEALSMFQSRHIDVPLLAMQPSDDPLHAVLSPPSLHRSPPSPLTATATGQSA